MNIKQEIHKVLDEYDSDGQVLMESRNGKLSIMLIETSLTDSQWLEAKPAILSKIGNCNLYKV